MFFFFRKQGANGPTIKEIVDRVSSVFTRLHVLVVGPGLSRDSLMLDTAKELIQKAREKNMAIVVDADGLFVVQQHPETVKDYKKAVLTPNVVEFQRLCDRMVCTFQKEKREGIQFVKMCRISTQRISQAIKRQWH
jgi:ATP-dependent NAD(P)H-hydrate dehydratase